MKALVDHNISPYIARALAILAQPHGHDVSALVDKFGDPSVPDVEWLRQLGREGGWTVISGDRRITRNPQEHAAWLQAQVITFFLANGWHRGMPQFKFAGRLISYWPDLVGVARRFDPPAAFLLQVNGRLKELTRLKSQRYEPPPP